MTLRGLALVLVLSLAPEIAAAQSAPQTQKTQSVDGAHATIGAQADAAKTDATQSGSVVAWLKGLVKIFADVWDSVNHRVKVDGSSVVQPISASSLPLPTGAAQEHTTAGSPSSTRLSDGSAFYKPTTPSDTQPISAASLPLPTGAAQDSTLTSGAQKSIVRGGAKGATTAADVTSTAEGTDHQAVDVQLYHGGTAKDPTQIRALSSGTDTVVANAGSGTFTNQQSNITADYDTGAGTQTTTMFGLALPKSGGAVAGGTATDPIRIDPIGTTTQPISAASLPLPSGAAQEHATAGSPSSTRLSDGAAFYKATTPSDTQPVSMATNTPVGSVAHDAPASTVNPLLFGCYGNTSAPADVSANVDAVRAWCLLNGSFVINLATGGALYDARQIRALTSSDVVTVNNSFLLDATFTGRLPAAAALADATANPSLTSIGSYPLLFNGTTWDRLRAASNGLNTTGTGLFASALVGQCDDTSQQALTENSFGHMRINCTTHRGKIEAVGELAHNGTAAATDRLGTLPAIAASTYQAATSGRNTAGTTGTGSGLLWAAALPEPSIASYSAAAVVAPAASATDIAVIPGNATNIVLLTELRVSCTQTTAGMVELHIIKRSSADTAGTSSSMTKVPDDANYAAASSAPLIYTANPTTGTPVGDLDVVKLGCMATGTTAPNDLYIGNFRQKPIVLRGTAQQVAINLNGATVSGGSFAVTFKWIETTGP